jgi:hypothetical protein
MMDHLALFANPGATPDIQRSVVAGCLGCSYQILTNIGILFDNNCQTGTFQFRA